MNLKMIILTLILSLTSGLIIPCSKYSNSCQKFNCCEPLICYENTACIHNITEN